MTRLNIFIVFLAMTSALMAEDTTEKIDTTMYEVSSIRDTLYLEDSIVVVHTICAPICSSCVRVYNKEWKLIGNLTPPFRTPFPEAYIEEDRIMWRNNDTQDYAPIP